ncbi:MAG TPA: hypothetical protein VN734_05450 [Acidobacteriaceae bacterium]|nr:hypothetical protein [Acidobacteriaceae bacterium]
MPLFAPGVKRLGGPREIQFTATLVGFQCSYDSHPSHLVYDG